MPTGYTAAIADDITFNQFAMNCARAFGALIMLRDEPGGGEAIPEKFEPSSYHVKAKAEDEAALAKLRAMTTEERVAASTKDYADAETSRLARITEMATLRVKYLKMLDHAATWQPPTSDHRELKDFMIEQIQQSIEFDCDSSYYQTPTARLTPNEWVDLQIHTLTKSIERHEVNHQEEVARTNSRNVWLAALRNSLK